MADRPPTPRSMGDRDAPHATPAMPGEDVRTILLNRISWGAVLAGVVVGLIAQLLLNLLGIGIGLGTLDPATGDNPSVRTFSIGAAAWWTLTGIIAAYVGGYAAGRLSGRPKESTAAWHGLVTWAVTTLVVISLVASAAGALVGGAFSAVSGTMGGLGSAAVTAAQTAAPALTTGANPFEAIERQIRSATGDDPSAARDAAIASVRALLTGDEAQKQQAREQAAQALARAQNIAVEQARERVAQYEQQFREAAERAKQQATEAADTAAKAISRGALLAFVALLLGGVAGWFGGRSGAVEPTLTSESLMQTQRPR
jgi:hypothetical protein